MAPSPRLAIFPADAAGPSLCRASAARTDDAAAAVHYESAVTLAAPHPELFEGFYSSLLQEADSVALRREDLAPAAWYSRQALDFDPGDDVARNALAAASECLSFSIPVRGRSAPGLTMVKFPNRAMP